MNRIRRREAGAILIPWRSKGINFRTVVGENDIDDQRDISRGIEVVTFGKNISYI